MTNNYNKDNRSNNQGSSSDQNGNQGAGKKTGEGTTPASGGDKAM